MSGIRGLWGRRASPCSWLRSGVLVAFALMPTPFVGVAAAAPSQPDIAATHAFLEAELHFQQTVLANTVRGRAASRALASQVARTCPNVLKGSSARDEPLTGELPKTPRAQGERDRNASQRLAARIEVQGAVLAPVEALNLTAARRLARTAAGLSWSDPRISQTIADEFRLSEAEDSPGRTPAQACADMRAWAGSGFRTLAPFTRDLREHVEASFEGFLGRGSVEPLLKPYEGPAGRLLLRRIEAIVLRAAEASDSVDKRLSSLQRTLGAEEIIFGGQSGRERKVGAGATAAGSRFSVVTQSGGPSNAPGSCLAWLNVEYTTVVGGVIGGLTVGAGPSLCIRGPQSSERPHLACESGDLTITASVAPARRVRLLLAGGRSIVSRTVLVPRRDGGPGAVYAQAVSAGVHPVALIELDAHGRVLRKLRLRRAPHCKPSEGEFPEMLTLASGLTPSGTAFTIQAIVAHDGSHSAPYLTAGPSSGDTEALFQERASQGIVRTRTVTECTGGRHYTIVYGELKAPGATVVAKTATGDVPLTGVPLPPSLRTAGSLVYGVFVSMPTELVVESSTGAALATESLSKRGADAEGYCEGLAEP